MTEKLKLHESLENAFIVGLLLTGSIQLAETMVLESVEPPCPDDLFSEALFRRVIHDSIQIQPLKTPDLQQNELESAASILPFELQCVLSLPENLRHCYVLRMLVGLPREVCAWLLHQEIWQVDQHTRAAMIALPLIQKRKSCSETCPETEFVEDGVDASLEIRPLSYSYLPSSKYVPATLLTNTKIVLHR